MKQPNSIRLGLLSAMTAAGPLLGALLDRLAGRLSHLESVEVDATLALLVAVLPVAGAVSALLPELDPSRFRPLRATGKLALVGSGAGLLSSTGVVLWAARTGGAAEGALAPSQLGYLIFGAGAGLVAMIPIAAVLLAFTLLLRRRGVRALPLVLGTLLVSLPSAAALFLTRTGVPSPLAALSRRAPPEPGRTRGAGPPEESPEQRRRRQVAGFVDELADHARAGRASEVARLVLEVKGLDLLEDLFRVVVDDGVYDALEPLFRVLPPDSPALGALTEARPDFGVETLNADTLRAIREHRQHDHTPFSLIIVPGYTPVKARRPMALDEIDAAVKRLEAALADLNAGLAPYVLVSGGSVHPAGTPHNEALSMRDWLLRHGVAADRILVDPFARHSTTNLRNAGRMMLSLGLKKGLIVTGFEASPFSQAFYFSHPLISSFETRSRRELGYSVGELDGLDDHHIAFVPSTEVTRINPRDPLDW